MKLGLYRHYSGKTYLVLGAALHTETLEPMVVYQRLYGDYGLWVRPQDMFEETVTIEGKVQPRFEYLGPATETPPNPKLK